MADRALVVVDMQNGFCRPEGLIYVPQAEEQIPQAARAIEIARENGVPIVYTVVRWESESDVVAGLKNNLPPLRERWSGPGGFSVGAWGGEVVDELAPQPDDPIVYKRAFDPPSLAAVIDDLGAQDVFVCGTTANNCVYAACLALFEASKRVFAISDCISSFDESFRGPWLANIDRYLGSVIVLDEFEEAVSGARARV